MTLSRVDLVMGARYPPYTEKKQKTIQKLSIPPPPPRISAGQTSGALSRVRRWLATTLCVLLAAILAEKLGLTGSNSPIAGALAFVQRLVLNRRL